jgi:Ca-activated chloride channel family protein
LGHQDISVSILPITASQPSQAFQTLAEAGHGYVMHLSNTFNDLEDWLNKTKHHLQFIQHANQTAPLWRDDGRWLLIPALLCLLPLFQRNRLVGMQS